MADPSTTDCDAAAREAAIAARKRKRANAAKAKRAELAAGRKQEVDGLVAQLKCMTTPVPARERRDAKRLKIDMVTLERAVRRNLHHLVRKRDSDKLEKGVPKLVKAAAIAEGLLPGQGGAGQTRRWLDPCDTAEATTVRRQLDECMAAQGGNGRIAGRLELEHKVLVPQRTRPAAAERTVLVDRTAAAINASTTADLPDEQVDVGAARQRRRPRRHGGTHYQHVKKKWLKRIKGRRGSRGWGVIAEMNLTDDQAKGLHKAFWMFCQKQRRMQRLPRQLLRR